MNVEILPPDINEGVAKFSISDGKIRYGLSGIKSVGAAVVDRIVEERKKNGRFKDLHDFLTRMPSKDTNKKTARERKSRESGQLSLFDIMGEDFAASTRVPYPEVEEYPDTEKLSLEKSVLGVYISGHPLGKYVDLLQKNCTAQSLDFASDSEDDAELDDA